MHLLHILCVHLLFKCHVWFIVLMISLWLLSTSRKRHSLPWRKYRQVMLDFFSHNYYATNLWLW